MLTEQQRAFAKVLELIEDAGCMEHVVLVGSWAEYVYREAGLLDGFAPEIRTLDVDFLVRNLRRPVPAANLLTFARERGYLIESDVMNGTTKLYDTSGLEVEFLIGKKGAGVEPALKTNVGVTAQALRHMEVLSGNAIKVPCLGHLVWVPVPEAYAIHKMIINSQRGKKAEKDARAIVGIWPFLKGDRFDDILGRLSKRERSRVIEFMKANELPHSQSSPLPPAQSA